MSEATVSRRAVLVGSAGLALSSGLLTHVHQAEGAHVRLSGVRGVVASPDGFLNMRTGPGVGYPVVTWFASGTTLTITNTSGDWFKASAQGYSGWLNSIYVRLTGTKSTVIRRGNTARKQVALTFDCGSDYGFTNQILSTLEQRGVIGSFSFTGDWLNSFPDGARRIVDDGHQIINHTLNHPSFTGVSTPGTGPRSPAKRLSQLQANEVLIRKFTGHASLPYWRPPYGDIDDGVLTDVGALGYTRTAMWTIDSLGWNGLSADDIYWRVMNNMVWGAIVLMHVGAKSQDANALDRMIRNLSSAGYGFRTVAQVIA